MLAWHHFQKLLLPLLAKILFQLKLKKANETEQVSYQRFGFKRRSAVIASSESLLEGKERLGEEARGPQLQPP